MEHGILHFPNPDVFENYLFGLEDYPLINSDKFESLFDLVENYSESNLRLTDLGKAAVDEFMDTPLLKSLDKHGMLSIGKYYIALDFDKELAYVTTEANKIVKLRSKDTNDRAIQQYSFEDELLSILFNNEGISKYSNGADAYYNTEGMRLQECPGTPRPGLSLPYRPVTTNPNPTVNRQESWVIDQTINGYVYRVRAKHAYQAAAIYFRLKSELEHYSRIVSPSSIFSPTGDPFASITYWGDFTPRRRAKRFLDRCFDECQGCWPQPANKEKIQKVHWEAGRRLTQVNLHMIFRGRIGGSHAGSGAIPYEFRLTPISR